MGKLFETLAGLSMAKALVFGGLAGGLYYMSMFDSGAGLEVQIAQVQSQLQVEEEKKRETEATLAEEARMRESVGILSQQYEEIAKKLPSVLVSIDINRTIDAFARNAGVSVKSKKPGASNKQEIVEEVPVDVVLEGSYSELAQFVYYVSIAERMTRVPNLVITEAEPIRSGNTVVTGKGKLKFEGTVVGYKLAEEKAKETRQ